MAQKDTVFEQTLKYKGLFNYSELYEFCYNWLKDAGYGISEDEYVEKVGGNGKEINISWKAGKKVSDYYKNVIEVSWKILGLNDAEAEENGKKIKTNKGDIKIKVSATLVKDYEDNWDKTPFWKTMRGIYDKYIIRTTNDEYEDRLAGKAQSFVEEVKAFLNLSGRR